MSRNTKIVLGILGGLLVVCACVAVVAVFALQRFGTNMVQSLGDPTKAAEVAGKIADYDIPTGYTQHSFNLFGLQMVMITKDVTDSRMAIMLMQFPASTNLSQEQMQQQLQQSMEQQTNTRGLKLQPAGTRDVTLRGQTVTLSIQEGTDDQGHSFRTETGVFQGKSGEAMLMIMGQKDNWDQAAVDTVINSMR